MSTEKDMKRISRRNFLVVSGLAGGGLMMSLALPFNSRASLKEGTTAATKLNTFLTIDPSGKITFLLTKHEMGQGSGTGIPMIFMDELGGDWNKLEIRRSDYVKAFPNHIMGTTGGSSSILFIWETMRESGAAAREMLKQAAANRWRVSTDGLTVENSYVINTSTGERFEFGELAEEAARLPVPEKVKLKEAKDFTYISKPVKNLLTKKIVRGQSYYGIDTDIEGMVYAAIVRCPVYKGKVVDYDDHAARRVEGVLDVIRIPYLEPVIQGNHVQEGVAVIATSTWAAFKGKQLLNVTWDEGELGRADLSTLAAAMDEIKDTQPEPTFTFGNTANLSEEDHDVLEMEYNNPNQAHALMEPINSTVHYRGDECEVWVGNQDGGRIAREVARVVNLPEEKIIVHVLNSGGSFGRRWYSDSSMEAAYLSRQLGKPVKLTWTREDEIQHDHFHPHQRDYYKVYINRKTKEVAGMENHVVKTDEGASNLYLWDQMYYFPNVIIRKSFVPPIVHQGAWRSVSEHSGTFGLECFIDELAHAINVDPLEYRLQLISRQYPFDANARDLPEWVRTWSIPARDKFQERAPVVLNYIKERGLWNIPLSAGQGKGLALGKFGLTSVAQIAIVNMNDPDYGYEVERVIAVVHCGRVVNPHFGKGQIEGAIIWALSALKYGGIEVEKGRVMRSNYHDNRVIRIDDCPKIDVHFIESDDAPSGLGEPGTPPLAPAVLNAIFNASGKRIRKIPVWKEDVS